MFDHISSEDVIFTMLWILASMVVIWLGDNYMKRFENVLEDTLKNQARNINNGIRLNVTLLLVSLSLFGYFKYYLRTDTSELKGWLGSLIDLLASVGQFVLYALALFVHWASHLVGSDYIQARPMPSNGVLLGGVIVFSYVVIKRLFFRRVPPLIWAAILVAIMTAFNFVSRETGLNLETFFQKTTDRINRNLNGQDSTATLRDSTLAPAIDTVTQAPVASRQVPPTQLSEHDRDRLVLKYSQQLESLIQNFASAVRRSTPDPDRYPDNRVAYQQAVVEHIAAMQRTSAHKNVVDLVNKLEVEKLLDHPSIQEVLRSDLCEYYMSYFSDRVCPSSSDGAFAN